MSTTQPTVGPRFSGKFRAEKPGFGFLMEPKGVNGQPPDDLPTIEGKPGGIFLATAVAKETLGAGVDAADQMDGERYSFAIRQSATHHGMLEAYDVRPLDNKQAI